MSLVLRKKCQSLLDGVGLDMYHIQVNEDNKYLEVAGECGQTLVTIQGIRLSKMAPGEAEIELALELFDAFLARHAATFKAFISAKKKAEQCVKPPTPKLEEAKVAKHVYYDKYELTFRMQNWDNSICTVSNDGEVSIPSRTIHALKDPESLMVQPLRSSEQVAIRRWVEAFNEYTEANNVKTKALEKLTTCEI